MLENSKAVGEMFLNRGTSNIDANLSATCHSEISFIMRGCTGWLISVDLYAL